MNPLEVVSIRGEGEVMDLTEIVTAWLVENGYDGLYSESGCACKVDDLMPCGCEGVATCEAGYEQPCDGTCEDGKCDFHISGKKEVTFRERSQSQEDKGPGDLPTKGRMK